MAKRKYDQVSGLPIEVHAALQEEFAVRDGLISELRQSLADILPLAEKFLSSAPSHPDNAKLETARELVKRKVTEGSKRRVDE